MSRFVTLAAILLPCSAAAAPLPPVGDYLDAAYIATLEKTHSPLQAAADDARLNVPQMVSVQADGAGRRFAANFNWRWGQLLFVLQRNGAIHRELAWGQDPGIALRITGPDGFCLAPPHAGEHCYRFVQDVAALVASTALAGHYADRQGAIYDFSEDRHAQFPGYGFSYAIMLDQTNDKYDFFSIGGGDRFMAFRRVGEMMTLYQVGAGQNGAFGTPDFTHPLAVLRQLPAPHAIPGNQPLLVAERR